MRAALDIFATRNLSTVRFLPSKCADHHQWKDSEIEHCRCHFGRSRVGQNLAATLNQTTTRTEFKKDWVFTSFSAVTGSVFLWKTPGLLPKQRRPANQLDFVDPEYEQMFLKPPDRIECLRHSENITPHLLNKY